MTNIFKMIKAEYLKKIESYEAMNKSLEKSCSELIKKRALDVLFKLLISLILVIKSCF